MKIVLLSVSNAMVTEVTFYCVRMLESEKLRKIGGLCDVMKKHRTKRISRSLSFNNESSFIFFFFLSLVRPQYFRWVSNLNFHFVLTNRILLISISELEISHRNNQGRSKKKGYFLGKQLIISRMRFLHEYDWNIMVCKSIMIRTYGLRIHTYYSTYD